MIFCINVEGIGDVWYALPVLRKFSKVKNQKLDILNLCKPLDEVLPRFDFIKSVNDSSQTGAVLNLFRLEDAKKKGLTLLNCNTSDFISRVIFNSDVILNDQERELEYPKIKTREFKNYDLVFHVAKTWESRSISEDVWVKLYKKYSADGYKIALIGKTVHAVDMSKTVHKLEVPEEDDFVNKLTLDETMNLIDSSKVLVTGQGGISVLAAGLKNPGIVVAEGCVKNEFRYIYRNGSYNYKTQYVKNPSGIYYTGPITSQVVNDTRQQPLFEDMVYSIDKLYSESA